MKRIWFTMMFALALTGSLMLTSCEEGGSEEGDGKEKVEKKEGKSGGEEVSTDGPEYTSAYICPMHCKGSGSDSPGECPVCGMAYQENPDAAGHDHDGHDHEGHDHEGHDHEGHDHDDHEGHDHG